MGRKRSGSRKKGLQGLAYYVIEVASKEELLTIAQRAQEVEAPIKWLTLASWKSQIQTEL